MFVAHMMEIAWQVVFQSRRKHDGGIPSDASGEVLLKPPPGGGSLLCPGQRYAIPSSPFHAEDPASGRRREREIAPLRRRQCSVSSTPVGALGLPVPGVA